MAIGYKTQTAKEAEAGKPAAFFVKPGDYKLKVIEAKEDTSTKGNDMIKLKLRVLLDDGNDGPSLFDYLVFSPSSRWKVDAFLKSADQFPGEGAEVNLDCDDMIGWECKAALKVEKYEGKENNKVEEYLFNEFD